MQEHSNHARPGPGRRGGRRPGAGAPRGNINALTLGVRSRRFFGAPFIVRVLPGVRQVVASLDLYYAEDRIAYSRLLQAATIFAANPAGPRQIEELTRAYLTTRVDQVPDGRRILFALDHMHIGKYQHLRPLRAIAYFGEVMRYIPELEAHVESRVVPWFWGAHATVLQSEQEETAQNSIKQSNNQDA